MKNKKDLKIFIRKLVKQQIQLSEPKDIELLDSFLIEGIDIDRDNRIVRFNPSHEDNTDTSINLNPTYYKVLGYDIISIFKRKENIEKDDGSPLVYALKGIKGWKIDVNSVIILLKQFIRITEKIKPVYDTIITVESSSRLNQQFLHRLNKIIKAEYHITDMFEKIPAAEVYITNFNGKNLSKEDSLKISKAFAKMQSENNGDFSFKYIPNKLRYTITKTIHFEPETDLVKYGEIINDKNVLILDDTISSGTTISEYCKNILEIFTPKSVTVITLFSSI